MSDGSKDSKPVQGGRPEGEFYGGDLTKWVAVFNVDPGRLVYRVNKTRIVIGSVVSADIRIEGNGIAPLHAVIEISQDGKGQATIFDLASDTGITVNGTKVVRHGLKSGDQIKIGSFNLKFSIEDVQKSMAVAKSKDSGGQRLFSSPGEDLAPLLLENERDIEEIFDYRPASKQALEIVMSWSETILDVQHFVGNRQVVIGSKKDCDFGIPPILTAAAKFSLVSRSGDSYVLNLDAKMTGIIQQNGDLRRIKEMGASQRIPLGRNDFAKISVGDVDFYLSYTTAPPQLKRRRLIERDPFLLKVLLTSLLFTAASITTMLTMKIPQTVDVDQVPERIAAILYQPEKFTPLNKLKTTEVVQKAEPQVKPEPPQPQPKKTVKIEMTPKKQDMSKPIPKVMAVEDKKKNVKQNAAAKPKAHKAQAEGKEGRGARAAGKEGQRGNPKAASGKEHQTMAKRPSPEGGAGRGGGHSQVPDEGNLDYLKGAGEKIENILGNSGQRLGKGGSDLKGFGGFDTRGNGGSGLTGTGKGGGGDAAQLGGLSDKGRGGGRIGTGLGAAGNGSSLAGGRTRVVLRTGGPEETVVMGSIDRDAIDRAIQAHRDAFKLCYEKEINAGHPDLAGRVTTSFVIGSNGRVTEAGVASSSLKNSNAESCILNVIKRIAFPLPQGSGIVEVTYPFKFTPVGHG